MRHSFYNAKLGKLLGVEVKFIDKNKSNKSNKCKECKKCKKSKKCNNKK